MFFVAVFIVAILSGATATVVGFGIGSLMTPLLAIRFGTTTAVALVTLPHAAATAVRCWRLRAHVDRPVLVRFGLLSAAGALAGALIYTRLGPGALTRVLGGLLLMTAVAQLTGSASRWQPHGPVVALFGLVSGFFGSIAGNQGGLRSAALTAFSLSPLGFVATATATGLLVMQREHQSTSGTRGPYCSRSGHPSSSPRSESSSGPSWASGCYWDCRLGVSARLSAGPSAHSGSGCS